MSVNVVGPRAGAASQFVRLDATGNVGLYAADGTTQIGQLYQAGAAAPVNFLVGTNGTIWLPQVSKMNDPNGTQLNTAFPAFPTQWLQDNRVGVNAPDAAAIVLRATNGGGVYRLSIHLEVTAYTSGALTYTVRWNDAEGIARTLVVTANAVGIQSGGPVIARMHIAANEQITGQLTGPFVGTTDIFACCEELQ